MTVPCFILILACSNEGSRTVTSGNEAANTTSSYAPAYSVIFIPSANTCPTGYTDYGAVGILSNNSDPLIPPYGSGVAPNANWTWATPRMCYVAPGSTTAPIANSIAFASSDSTCPSGYTKVGQAGVMWNTAYMTNSYYGSIPIGSGWDWALPVICYNSSSASIPSGAIALSPDATSCPTGYTVRGIIGILRLIVAPYTTDCTPFTNGAVYGAGW